jgi:hypothetical protein
MESEPFVFPRCLYGDDRRVRSAWNKVTKQAWKDGHWGSALSQLEFCSFASLSGHILTASPKWGLNKAEDCWRMYWLGNCLKDAVHDESKDIERFNCLLIDGLEWFWFALGLLEHGSGSFYLQRLQRKTPVSDLEAKLLKGFCRWVGPFMALKEHYRGPWATNILTLARWGAMGLTYADFEHAGGDLKQALVLAGVFDDHPSG